MKIWRIMLLLVVGILILSACQPAEPETVEVTRVVTETEQVEVEVPVEVTRVITETIVEEGEEVEVTRIVEVAAVQMEALPYEGIGAKYLDLSPARRSPSRCKDAVPTSRH